MKPGRGKAGEVGVDEFLCRLLRDADVLGERERRLSVEERVVDDLRAAAQLVLGSRCPRQTPSGGPIVDVLAAPKASISACSPDRCARTRNSICE